MAYDEFQDRHYDEVATIPDAIREFAWNVGHEEDYRDQAWIASDYDTWTPNPHYRGPKEPHPESDEALHMGCKDDPCEACLDWDADEDIAAFVAVIEEDDDFPF